MKKIISIILCVMIIMSYATFSSAQTADAVHDITVVFSENSVFTAEEKEIIVESFLNPYSDNQDQTYGLTCTLLGHDYVTESTYTIQHKVLLNRPRCVKSYYDVSICSRCSDMVKELTKTIKIDCCQ